MKRFALVVAFGLIIAGGALAAAAISPSGPFTFTIDQNVTLDDGSTARLHGDLTVDVAVATPTPTTTETEPPPPPPPPTEPPPPPPPPTEPPPPADGTLVVTDHTFVCDGPVDYDLVQVTISQIDRRMDAVRLASGCTGRIGRLEVDTWNADGIHIGPFAHDLVIESGYATVHGRCNTCDALHADVIQVMGGQRITFRNFAVELQYSERTNSALYINCGQSCQQRPTDVVFENSTFKRTPDKNRVVRIGNSLRSGIRNSTVYWCGTGSACDAPSAPAIWFNGLQTDPVNENNTLVLAE